MAPFVLFSEPSTARRATRKIFLLVFVWTPVASREIVASYARESHPQRNYTRTFYHKAHRIANQLCGRSKMVKSFFLRLFIILRRLFFFRFLLKADGKCCVKLERRGLRGGSLI